MLSALDRYIANLAFKRQQLTQSKASPLGVPTPSGGEAPAVAISCSLPSASLHEPPLVTAGRASTVPV